MPVFAQIDDPINQACTEGNASASPVCQDTPDNPVFGSEGILTKAINFISIFVAVAAVIMIIVSGLRMILSSGNPEKVAGAKNGVIYSLIGLVVALIAQSIVVFVLNKL